MSYSAFVQFVQDCKITSLDWQDFRMAFALGKDTLSISVPIRRFRFPVIVLQLRPSLTGTVCWTTSKPSAHGAEPLS